MIIVKVQGGLGNQMFQYAAGRSLASRLNTELKLDISDYRNKFLIINYLQGLIVIIFKWIFSQSPRLKKWEYELRYPRTFELHRFQTKYKLANHKDILRCKEFKEPHFHYTELFEQLGDNTYLVGFWQSERYFKCIEPLIRAEFKLKKPIEGFVSGSIGSCNSVGIHVRRGDFSYCNSFGVLDQSYNERAIDFCNSLLGDVIIFVFSDDPLWINSNLQKYLFDKNHVIMPYSRKSFKDLFFMSCCKHNIVANSSFSWWAAWLNNNEQKIIIVPLKPFKSELLQNIADYYPCDWKKL